MDDDFEDFDAEDVGTPNPELDDLGFIDEDVTPARKRRKDYEVEHKVIPGTELTRKVKHDIHEVTSILNVNPGIAYALLVKYHWKQERLLEEYYENETGVLVKAGVAVRHPKVPAATVGPVAGFECTICCDDDPALEVVTLMCGHQACLRCYTSYVNTKLATETDCRLRCIERKCDLIVPEDIILRCASPAMTNRYFRLQLDQYMRDHQYYKWCPAPRCERALECHISPTQLDRIVPTVKCECGNAFCFGCGNQDHMPATCTIAKRWLKKCADDSETANWISAHTKECPKCHATIEKNGGCNHMTCKKCKYEFCWVCQGPWTEHGSSWYQCNRFDDKKKDPKENAAAKSREDLNRYLHYFTRYDNHDRSAKLDQEVYATIERTMEALQAKTELSWIEVQFLKQAADILFQCRMTLKWTYAFAFYLKRNNQTEIFEDNQRDLELAVEQLSEMLERPIDFSALAQASAAAATAAGATPKTVAALRQEIVDKAQYVDSRRQVLLSDTARGLLEGRWQYIEEQSPAAAAAASSGSSQRK